MRQVLVTLYARVARFMTSFYTQRPAVFLVQTKRYVIFPSGLPHSFGSPLSTPIHAFQERV
jgi:hypothetical protein